MPTSRSLRLLPLPHATLSVALLLPLACSGDDGGSTSDAGTSTSEGEGGSSSTGGGTSVGTTEGTTAGGTMGGSSGSSGGTTEGTTTGTDEPSPSDFCDDEGLPVADFDADAGGTGWNELAGDFTVNTTFGTWNLAERWSGCDSYVFISHIPDGDGSQLINSLKTDLFTRSASNVHYFFLSYGQDPAADAEMWQFEIGTTLVDLDAEQQALWMDRVHFVTDAATAIEGSVGAFLSAQPEPVRTLGIDRAQRWDHPGMYQDTLGGGFSPDINVLGYLGRYYNFRYDQDQALAAQDDVTVVPMMESQVFAPDCMVGEDCFDQQNGPFSNSNNNQVWEVMFPDAATMAGFDTMEFDLQATCGPSNYSDCGHWDYEAFIQLCDDQECMNREEVIRWITPYSRPGTRRWVVDTTPFLGMVKDGGAHYFRFGMLWNMNPATWDMSFRLRNTGVGDASATVIPAFKGNHGFNDTYNDNWSTLNFTPPQGTKRVELVAIISGHGQEALNCAEWCEHQHEFTVNGSATHLREFPGQVISSRCGEAVDEGVVPGQYGNWTPGRAGWCPGLPVQPWRVDITDDVTIGQDNTLDYEGKYNGGNPVGGRIRLNSYVVFYE